MNDISKLKNYRLKYKRYYGIDFGNDFDIHHMDFNHSNNDINNLLLLPKKLHKRYHYHLNCLQAKKGKIVLNTKLYIPQENAFDIDIIEELCEDLREIQKWLLYKNKLETTKKIKEFENEHYKS